eukprot:g8792.t1
MILLTLLQAQTSADGYKSDHIIWPASRVFARVSTDYSTETPHPEKFLPILIFAACVVAHLKALIKSFLMSHNTGTSPVPPGPVPRRALIWLLLDGLSSKWRMRFWGVPAEKEWPPRAGNAANSYGSIPLSGDLFRTLSFWFLARECHPERFEVIVHDNLK